jgi:hypothetical protein
MVDIEQDPFWIFGFLLEGLKWHNCKMNKPCSYLESQYHVNNGNSNDDLMDKYKEGLEEMIQMTKGAFILIGPVKETASLFFLSSPRIQIQKHNKNVRY